MHHQKNIIIDALESLMLYMNGFPACMFFSGKGHVLSFHRVIPQNERSSLGLRFIENTPAYLEQVIEFLRTRKYDFISINDLPQRLTRAGGRFVVFSFDDGYRDIYTTVYPIMKKHHIPFVVYLTTSFPDKSALLWEYLLENILNKQDQFEFSLNGAKHHFICPTLEQKRDCYETVRKIIMCTTRQEYRPTLEQIFKPYLKELYNKITILGADWQQIKALSEDPLVTIGSHMVNHVNPKMLTDDELVNEILESINIIESRINIPVRHFAFPYGGRSMVGEREFAIADTFGFQTIVTTRHANIFREHLHSLRRLPRLSVHEQDLRNLKLYIYGIKPCLENLFKRIVTV